MEIVGTLVLIAPAAIVFLVLHLRSRAAAEDKSADEAAPERAETGRVSGP
jgi:hypothetical protein